MDFGRRESIDKAPHTAGYLLCSFTSYPTRANMKATTASLLLAFVQLALAHPGGHYEPSERDQAVFEAAKATSSAGRVNEPAPSTNSWLEKYGAQTDLGYTVRL